MDQKVRSKNAMDTDQLLDTITAISDGIIVINKQGQIKYTNSAVNQILTSSFKSKLRPQQIQAQLDQIIKLVLQTDNTAVIDYQIANTKKWLEISSYISQNGDYIIYLCDNTSVKQKEIDLQQYATVADIFLEVAPIGFGLLDKDLKFLRLNQQLADMGRVSVNDSLGKPIKQVFPSLHPYLIKVMKKVLKTKLPILNLDVEGSSLESGENKVRKFVVSYFPVKLDHSSVTLLGILVRDVTERRKVESQLETTKANLSYLSEASKILASSLDYNQTLQTVARLAVPKIADWCSIDLLNEENEIAQVAIYHKDKRKLAWAKSLRKHSPPSLESLDGVGYVIKNGKEVYFPKITNQLLKQKARSREEITILKKVGFTSVIIVPISIENITIGAITFVTAESGRNLNETDVAMARELASRASLAIHNAQLFEKVTNEQKRLNELIMNIPGLVWETRGKPDQTDQQITFVSKFAEKMLGYSQEEWLNTPNFWLKLVHPDDKDRASQTAQQTFKKNEVGVNRFRWIKQNGEECWVETHSSVIKDKRGRKIGMRGVTMDITDRMQMEKQKDEFIGIVSHELKTPVTSLKAYAQVLQRRFIRQNDSVSAYHLQKMDNQLNKLTVLINDLLDATKIEAGKLKLFKEEFNIHDLINEVVQEIQMTSNSHTIRTTKFSKPQTVLADRERIGQVLINLLSNAIKYSPHDNQVIVRVRALSHSIQVSVQDFGVGIPKDKLSVIFNRFYRVSGSRRESFPGMGLGLYISSEIVRRHKGEIWAESTVEKGTTFFFTLPK